MDTANFSQQLRVLPTLVKTLAEDDTLKFKVSASGHLSVLRKTRWSAVKKPLDTDAVQSLAAEVAARAEKAVLGPWFLCTLRGADGLTIFGERRIDLPANPLPNEVREELLQLARAGSTGLVAGGVGSNKGSILLWLASQLGRRELVLVSDVPPRELPAPTATHVFPPANERERRDLERLLRAHDCIFWDRINRSEDLLSFTSTPGSHNRWFSVDAASPEALGHRLRTMATSVGKLHLNSCMFIDVDAEAGPRIASLCRREDGGWTELLPSGPALTKALGELGELLAAPEHSEEHPQKQQARQEHQLRQHQARKRRPSPQAGIISPKRVGASRSKPSISGADEPPEEPTVDSAIEPLSEDVFDEIEEVNESSQSQEFRGMSVAELKDIDVDETALLRSSGEIDLQSFVRARNARRQQLGSESSGIDETSSSGSFAEPPAGLGLEQSSEHAATNIADGAKVDAMLAKMAEAGDNGQPPQFPDVNPDELTPPVRDETTALTPVDMERIRESADDDLSWLVGDSLSEPLKEEQTLQDVERPSLIPKDQNTRPASPIWEADPAPTDELSEKMLEETRTDLSDPDHS